MSESSTSPRNNTRQLLTALAMLGTPTSWPHFFTDEGYRDAYLITYQSHYGDIPPEDHAEDDDIVHELTDQFIRKFKQYVGAKISQASRDLEREAFHQAEKQKRQAQQSFREMSAVSPHGTTAEIATSLNVSKKQVRRWKAEGILDQKIAEHTAQS